MIKDFYADSTVFVTGGTGFLGKALLEKLLRTCDKVQTVYVLMREKKQQSCDDRFQKWLQDPVRYALLKKFSVCVTFEFFTSGGV